MATGDDRAPRDRESRRRAGLDAIIAATTRLTEQREFDELSVLDICVEADVSISSFYHRFRSKDALLEEVHVRYLADVRESLWLRLGEVDWQTEDHQALIAEVVSEYVQLRLDYARRFRTMALAEQRHPELAAARQLADQVAIDALAELFAARFDEGTTRSTIEQRVTFITRVVVLVAQDLSALGRTFSLAGGDSDAALVDRLVELVVAYLAPVLTDASLAGASTAPSGAAST